MKAYWEGLVSSPSLSLAFLSLASLWTPFEAAILKAFLLVFHIMAGAVSFADPAVTILRSGWG